MPGSTASWGRRSNMRNLARLLLVAMLVLPAMAEHDFLSSYEVDQIREAQEPVARIRLYLLFAKQRLDQVQSLLAKNRSGRSGEIRQLLEDYTSIVDAIGSVTDDALVRKTDVTLAPPVIVEGEKKFLDQLKKFEAGAPSDLEMYSFELKDAIEATSDAIDTANEDLSVRGNDVNARAAQTKKEVEAVNAAERKAGIDPTLDKAEAAGDEAAKPPREAPTLYRPGEKADPPVGKANTK